MRRNNLMIVFVTLAALLLTGVASAAPVALMYADHEYHYPGNRAFGYVEVENLAYQKQVTIVYRYGSGEWQEVEAVYHAPTLGGKEAWRFETGSIILGYKQSVVMQFAVRYRVNGQEYWDNNGGNDYTLEFGYSPIRPDVLLQAAKVWLDYAGGSYAQSGGEVLWKKFTGTVYVKQFGAQRSCSIVYTTDNWATVHTAPAAFNYAHYGDVETWRFSFDVPVDTRTLKYAIKYVVDGQEYWDNNFTQDYSYSYNL